MNDLRSRLAGYADAITPALDLALADLAPDDLKRAALHYPAAGGKRLRPAFALLAAEAVGARREFGLPFAIAVELVHNFSLVHDDVMDEDDLRRGLPTVHVKWGIPTAILAGDVLLAKAFQVIAEGAPHGAAARDASKELAEATRLLCEGQALDMAFERDGDVTEEDYLRMIHGKTARLFEAAARGGAILAGAKGPEREALGAFGAAFGMAFQVQDDLLDLTESTVALGKPALSDLKRGKRTLVRILAEARASPAELQRMKGVIGNPGASDADARQVVDLFERLGAMGAARARVREYTDRAVGALDALPDSPARQLLRDVALWAGTRRA